MNPLVTCLLAASPLLVHGLAGGTHDHPEAAAQESVQRPTSAIALLYPKDAPMPDADTAAAALKGSRPLDDASRSAAWTLMTDAGALTLGSEEFSSDAILAPIDELRFTRAERARLVGELQLLTLESALDDGGLPALHAQIQALVAAADELGLEGAVGLYDHSATRWHPPGWVERMTKSEAGPAPASTYIRHGVFDENDRGEKRYWIHSHGLARFTGFEVGCIDVREQHREAVFELVGMASNHAVDDSEWPESETAPILYGLELARIPWAEAVRTLKPEVVGTDEDHLDAHTDASVLVVEGPDGWTSPGPAASALEGFIVAVSERETARGALAARETYEALRAWHRASPVEHYVMVKCPIEVNGGEDREHVWFDAEYLGRKRVRGVLMSDPRGEAELAPGDSDFLDPNDLTGWMVQTRNAAFGPDDFEAMLVLAEDGR
ncbi:MAG: DUF2314 domain-containing protein [Planctomycetota bacterium]